MPFNGTGSGGAVGGSVDWVNVANKPQSISQVAGVTSTTFGVGFITLTNASSSRTYVGLGTTDIPTFAGVVATGQVTGTVTNSGSFALRVPSPNAVGGDFTLGAQEFPAVNSFDGSSNFVWNVGLNVGTNGARLDTSKPMVRIAFEDRWFIGSNPYTEFHIASTGADGVEHRVWSVASSHSGSAVLALSQCSQYVWQALNGTQRMLFDMDGNAIQMVGTGISQSLNNIAWIAQRNAANTTALSLPYYDNQDRLRLDGGNAVYIAAGGIYSPSPILVKTDSNELVLRNGTQAQTLTIARTFTDASNFSNLSIRTQAGSNPTLIGHTILGTGTAPEIQFQNPTTGFYSSTTTGIAAYVQQFPSNTANVFEARSSAGTAGVTISPNGSILRIGNVNLGGVSADLFANSSSTMLVMQNGALSNNSKFVDFIMGNAVTGVVNATSISGSATSAIQHYIQQNGAGAARTYLLMVGSGDPCHVYEINGVTQWSHGIDNSDSDAFVLSKNTTLGNSNALRFATDLSGEVFGPFKLKSYTVATAPAASAYTGYSIAFSDRSFRIGTSDGTVWNYAGSLTPVV
jgi:hypothetical protein